MITLLLSTRSLPAGPALADAAREIGWTCKAFDENPMQVSGRVVYYGGTDLALRIANQFHLALLEPPLDLLTRLPLEFRQRAVEYCRFGDLRRLKNATFVKPADALNKAFDAGIYTSACDIRAPKGVSAQTQVLLAEPVEWLAEYRCFILEKEVAAWTPYISFGRPTWKPFDPAGSEAPVPANLCAFVDRFFARSRLEFPPAFVIDIGLIEDRGWAVVEFNPVWCSGLLGANPRKVLAVLERACQDEESMNCEDKRWLVARK